jgi:hypothetical protein
MSDIVKRLLWRAEYTSTPEATTPKLCAEAAAAIASLIPQESQEEQNDPR